LTTQKNTGERNLNAADRLKQFLDGIDVYVSCRNLTPTKFSEEFALAETLTLEQMDKLTRDDCFNLAYMLYQYADHVASEKAGQETVINWCENSLNSIISSEIHDMSGEYIKHDIKVATILRNHELARKIKEWQDVAKARLAKTQSREYNIRRKAEILFEKGKRK